MDDRVGQEALDEHVDLGVQGGGEEQPLPVARGLVEQAPDDREEAEVGHVVGLVDDRDLDRSRAMPWPCLIRSSSRPGQAMRMSTPRRSAATCGPWPTPPKTVREVRPVVAASGARAASIWPTSSRVGARISARGAPGRRRGEVAESRATSGSRNAYVLPEPVRPRPRTSRPARASGSVAAWMGVGSVMPRAGEDADEGSGHAERAEVVLGQGDPSMMSRRHRPEISREAPRTEPRGLRRTDCLRQERKQADGSIIAGPV